MDQESANEDSEETATLKEPDQNNNCLDQEDVLELHPSKVTIDSPIVEALYAINNTMQQISHEQKDLLSYVRRICHVMEKVPPPPPFPAPVSKPPTCGSEKPGKREDRRDGQGDAPSKTDDQKGRSSKTDDQKGRSGRSNSSNRSAHHITTHRNRNHPKDHYKSGNEHRFTYK